MSLTYLTAEPFLAHFGIGGFGNGTKMTEMFFRREGITGVTNAPVKEVRPGEIELADGRILPFAYAMLAPAFLGAAAVRKCSAITNANGFVEVNDFYQTAKCPEVYAAGVAVAVKAPDQTQVPCGVPKTGYLSEEMAKVLVHNIVADLHGAPKVGLPLGTIDAKCRLGQLLVERLVGERASAARPSRAGEARTSRKLRSANSPRSKPASGPPCAPGRSWSRTGRLHC